MPGYIDKIFLIEIKKYAKSEKIYYEMMVVNANNRACKNAARLVLSASTLARRQLTIFARPNAEIYVPLEGAISIPSSQGCARVTPAPESTHGDDSDDD